MVPSRAKPAQKIVVVGGGLAGLSTAIALGSAGYAVSLYESRPFLGGRASSYPINSAGSLTGLVIDNSQHILLRCCINLQDFYRRLQVDKQIDFHREFFWIEPGGRISTMRKGLLPAPLHFTESFARLHFLTLAERLAIGRALLAIRHEYRRRPGLDNMTMLEWLNEKKQPPRAIDRFWRQVLVSAINEELDRMAAIHGLQVFFLGFLARSNSYEMGIAKVPLGSLYASDAWSKYTNITLHQRAAVSTVCVEGELATGVLVNGDLVTADAYILAVPVERVQVLAPELNLDLTAFAHSPITGVHLWFDRSITGLPHATLLDRHIHWLFNKHGGKYVQITMSAARETVTMSREAVIDLAVRELGEFFPLVKSAHLEHAHVVKEVRATFSASPGLESKRPANRTRLSNLFLAGDWTRSGWPATMEGAVRSGYLAAEAVTASFANSQKFLLPDIA